MSQNIGDTEFITQFLPIEAFQNENSALQIAEGILILEFFKNA